MGQLRGIKEADQREPEAAHGRYRAKKRVFGWVGGWESVRDAVRRKRGMLQRG